MFFLTHSATRNISAITLFKTLSQKLTQRFERHRTQKALRDLRPNELRDAGLMAHDIDRMNWESSADAIEALARRASQRSGNW